MDAYLQFTVVAVFVSLVFLYTLLGKAKKYSYSKEAPEPAGSWPRIGQLHLLLGADQLLYRTLGAMADKYGSAFNIRLGSRRDFVVSSWEVAKDCFTISDEALASRPATVAAKHMGYNYAVHGFSPYNSFWREMRKISTLELLSIRRLEMLKHDRFSENEMGLKELYILWVQNSSSPLLVDLKHWSEELTLNVAVRMVAGKRYISYSAASDSGEKHEKAMKKNAKEMDSILGGWLEEHLQRRVSGEVKADGEQDFIDDMLSLRKKVNSQLFNMYDTDTSVKSTCLALILGGSDTASGTLTWAISQLLNNRKALKKAQEELEHHVGMHRHRACDRHFGAED